MTTMLRVLSLCSSLFVACTTASPGLNQAKGGRLVLFAAAESASTAGPCQRYGDGCFVLQQQLGAIDDPRYDVILRDRPGFIFHLGRTQQHQLRDGVERLRPARVAVVLDGDLLHVAKVRGAFDAAALQVTFCDRQAFERALWRLARCAACRRVADQRGPAAAANPRAPGG